MWVVILLARDVFLHGEVPGDANAVWSDEGVEVGEGVVAMVFGDELISVEDFEGGVGFFLSEFTEGAVDEDGKEEKRAFHCFV